MEESVYFTDISRKKAMKKINVIKLLRPDKSKYLNKLTRYWNIRFVFLVGESC